MHVGELGPEITAPSSVTEPSTSSRWLERQPWVSPCTWHCGQPEGYKPLSCPPSHYNLVEFVTINIWKIQWYCKNLTDQGWAPKRCPQLIGPSEFLGYNLSFSGSGQISSLGASKSNLSFNQSSHLSKVYAFTWPVWYCYFYSVKDVFLISLWLAPFEVMWIMEQGM